MYLSRLHLIFSLFLLSFSQGFTQEYLFDAELFTTADGLPNLFNSAVTKDKDSFIWGATPDGIYRYNGYEFEHYKIAENESELKRIRQIKVDEQNNLWLFSADFRNSVYPDSQSRVNIEIFDTRTKTIISFENYFSQSPPFLPEEVILSKIIDAKNRLWVATKIGELFLFKDGVFNKIFEKKGTFFQYITVDATDKIWLGYEQTMIQISIDGALIESVELPEQINGIWTEGTSQLWLSTGVWEDTTAARLKSHKYTARLWSKTTDGQLLPLDLVKNGTKLKPTPQLGIFIHRSQQGLWYIKKGGQLQLFDKNGHFLFNFHSIIGMDIYTGPNSYLEDESHLWFPTPIGVIQTKVARNPFKLIHKDGKYSDCRDITEDEQGNIYFQNKKAYRWNRTTNNLTKLDIGGNPLLIYTDSLLWSPHFTNGVDAVFQFNLHTAQKSKDLLPTNIAQITYCVLPTENPYQRLLGTDKGLCYVDFYQKSIIPFTKYNEFDTLKTCTVYDFHSNEKGTWLATNKGIFSMTQKGGVLGHYNKKSGDLPYNHIHHIHEDAAGVFWLATKGGGIIRWQPALGTQKKSISRQFTTEDGLSHNKTYGIYEDSFDKLWISSDIGLMRMGKKDFHIETFLVKDGIPHNEFNLTSHYQTKDSTLYFGGLGGLIAFDPKVFAQQVKKQIPFHVTKLTVLETGKEEVTKKKVSLLKETQSITLQPDDKFLGLHFSLLDYEDPKQHEYRYKIEGFDDNWTKMNDNYLRINSLPHGSYTLKIKGKNNRSDWSKELALTIIQKKPFYLHNWFLILMGLLILLAFRLILIRREVNLKKQNKQLEDKVQARTIELEEDKKIIKEQAEKLQQVDKAKTRFFNNITHEIRTPLTLIIGPAEQLLTKKLAKPYKAQIQLIKKNATHLLTTINQLLDISKIESGAMNIEYSEGDIIAFSKDLMQRFQPLAFKNHQQLSFIHDLEKWNTYFDKDKFSKIIHNLLSNALKFTSKNGEIQLNISRTEQTGKDYIALMVKDTGRGISEVSLPKVFDRFYEVDTSSTRKHEGTGIGLSLVKELIEIQDGTIEVESQVGKGTTFRIMLPVLDVTTMVVNADAPKLEVVSALNSRMLSKAKEDVLKNNFDILLIEDNTEMRTHIQSCITGNYTVYEAVDGAQGIEMAIEKVPDLIVSDIMMPNKNGYEVTKAIRSNINTSHIPMILLTAKTALDSRLKGLDRGADAYLTKPFSAQELNLRIRKLIEIRALLQQRFQGKINLEKEAPTFAFEQEDSFIQAVKTIIEKELTTSTLNGEFIGKQLGMSRMQIHRKLKALTNQSAREFITEFRLQKGFLLLKEGRVDVAEAAYQTGFNTPGYFSKLFKNRFGTTPSEIINERK